MALTLITVPGRHMAALAARNCAFSPVLRLHPEDVACAHCRPSQGGEPAPVPPHPCSSVARHLSPAKGPSPFGAELFFVCLVFASAFPTQENLKSTEENQCFQGPFQLRWEGGDQPLHSPGKKQRDTPPPPTNPRFLH